MPYFKITLACLLPLILSLNCPHECVAGGEIPTSVHDLLDSSCLQCHQKGGDTPLDLSTVTFTLDDPSNFQVWEDIFDRLSAGDMPPATEPKPSADKLHVAMQQLQHDLHQASLARQDRQGRVPARRLTNLEYANTIRDLLLINDQVSAELPAENDSGRFDTIGVNQRLSAVHMAAYMKSSDRAIDAALRFNANPYRDFEIDIPNSPRLAYHDGKTFIDGGGIYLRLGKGVVLFTENDFLLPSHAHGFDVPISGKYRITFRADAYRSDSPVVMKVICKGAGGSTRLLAAFDVEPGDPQTYEISAILHPGDSFYPAFVMGDGTDMQYIMANGIDGYTGKGLAIRSYRVEGPLMDAWPPPSVTELLRGVTIKPLANQPQQSEHSPAHGIELPLPAMHHLNTIISRFVRRAFRRQPTDEELKSFTMIAKTELDHGESFLNAVRASLQSVISAPQFLLFDSAPDGRRDYALASRLSYFLWRSMPDEELFQLADQGKLRDELILRAQVERMLKNHKSRAFVNDFVGQWLRLYKINANTPDQRLYWEYDELLGNSLVQETQRFLADLMQRNLPAENIIDSDFTFLNRRLAEHYGITGVKGQHFRRVSLPTDSVRGGVLTHASVLKTTANGSLTSPVIRGNFVLSNFLGTPPEPPPPSAGSIEPDTRGTKTVRQQLAAHRDVESCNMCHRKIDPPGFALESFDPIGRYRHRYRALVDGQIREVLEVDASGLMQDGQSFSDIRDFKRLLMDRKESFVQNLTAQLIVFSTGGEIDFSDRESIHQIMNATRANDFRMRDLIHEIVQSRIFREL